MKKLVIGLTLLSSTVALAQSSSELEKKLESLSIPDDKVTTVLSEDKLYVLNNRYSSLINRHELTVAGANNFTADSHLVTQQAALSYRYHINSKWSLGARYTRYTNKLSSAGQILFNNKSIIPDTDFAMNGQELFVNYNTIYGKLRWSEDSVVYFDQYISLGGGKVKLSSGDKNLALADISQLIAILLHSKQHFLIATISIRNGRLVLAILGTPINSLLLVRSFSTIKASFQTQTLQ